MYYFYFDASGLVKRYTEEVGSDKIDFLFQNVPLNRLMCLAIGVAEVFSICVRKRNDGRITRHHFDQAIGYLDTEVINTASAFETVPAQNVLIWQSIRLMDIHSINSVDAILLCSALDIATNLRNEQNELVLVASDQRLLRAAQSEGLLCFNPETDSQQILVDWVVIR
ncbi:MAG: type II toxin-antitoxin system VapC family toxin [Candidatus Poribacteria bacterium]|nr:type II toxin-antitoxin system VapC family toxin [Candidatus Poribacteria bacterium]